MKLVLMGPPASGKGTVGALLSEKLNLPIFSVGQLLREIPKTSAFYETIHEDMDEGELVPEGIPAGLIREELEKEKYKDGYILDGWLRDMLQKEYFDPEADNIIFLNVSDETAIKRIAGRRYCPKDKFSCNIYTLPPNDPNSCDKCGGELEQREDDNEEVVKTRLELYKNETLPVIEFYRQAGNLLEVDGEGTPEEVLDLVLKKLNGN